MFDTQIAAGCIGLKPQIGYAELVKTLLDVTVPKGQTRTDWSKRPLTREQLEYAADDVLYSRRDRGAARRASCDEFGREHWVTEDCAALEDRELYEPDLTKSWQRLRGIAQLAAGAARARQGHRRMARTAGARARSAARLDLRRCRDFRHRPGESRHAARRSARSRCQPT